MSMRIAIAGGGGFAYMLARELAQSSNAVLVLSTRQRPGFEQMGIQVATVNYANAQELQYTLKGVDILISTIRDATVQINLIDAARYARVRTFVPSEFEGAIAHRPTTTLEEPIGQASAIVRHHLAASSHPMRHTIFSCGILYERFLPGGLGRLDIGRSANVLHAGDYLLNIQTAVAEVVKDTAEGRPVVVSMTSVHDVARFVAAAVDIGLETWPIEFRMRGDQLTIGEIVSHCSTARRVPFQFINHEYSGIQAQLDWAYAAGNFTRWCYFQQLRASAEGRFDFERANLNELVEQIDSVCFRPERFRDWVWRVCGEAGIRGP